MKRKLLTISVHCHLQSGGFYNVTVHQITDRRGDAHKGDLISRPIDFATGHSFDAELLPRVSSVSPRAGSAAGGTELTVFGSGFGSTLDLVRVTAAGASCVIGGVTRSAA